MHKEFCEHCGERAQKSAWKLYCDYCGREMERPPGGYAPHIPITEVPHALVAEERCDKGMCAGAVKLEVTHVIGGTWAGGFDCCLDCLLKLLQKAKEEQCQTTNA